MKTELITELDRIDAKLAEREMKIEIRGTCEQTTLYDLEWRWRKAGESADWINYLKENLKEFGLAHSRFATYRTIR